MEAVQSVSTLEVIKAGYPLIAGLVICIVWIARVQFITMQNKKDVEDLKLAHKSGSDGLYESIKEAEREFERKFEKVLEKFDGHLVKVYEEINKTNIHLAEMKGRLYSKSEHEKN